MNYNKIYNQIIERAKDRELECYTEKHHIIPRCMGGSDEESNLAKLTPEEHYVCHQLLVKIHPGNSKLIYAANMMCAKRDNKSYGWIRRRLSEAKRGKKMPADWISPKKGKTAQEIYKDPDWVNPRKGRTAQEIYGSDYINANKGRSFPKHKRKPNQPFTINEVRYETVAECRAKTGLPQITICKLKREGSFTFEKNNKTIFNKGETITCKLISTED